MKQTDEFWSTDEHAERLDLSFHDAFTTWFDGFWGTYASSSFRQLHPIPRKLKNYRWVRETLPKGHVCADSILEQITEWLDFEYGDPDRTTELSDLVKKAAQELVDAVYDDFVPWTCVVADFQVVDVQEYLEQGGTDCTDIEWGTE